MNISLSVGILNFLPEGFIHIPEDENRHFGRWAGKRPPPRKKDTRSPSKEAKLAYLKRVAALGIANRFNEVIEDEVAELSFQNGKGEGRWLLPNQAREIIAAVKSINASMPFSAIPSQLSADFYFPTMRAKNGVTTTLPDFDMSCFVLGARTAGDELQRDLMRIDQADRDFARDLMNALQLCERHRLVLFPFFLD